MNHLRCRRRGDGVESQLIEVVPGGAFIVVSTPDLRLEDATTHRAGISSHRREAHPHVRAYCGTDDLTQYLPDVAGEPGPAITAKSPIVPDAVPPVHCLTKTSWV
jgi:hypothetical protein